MPRRLRKPYSTREKVEKAVAERVEAGFVTDVIVIFRPSYRRGERRILAAKEPQAVGEKIQVLQSAVMKSLDIVAGAVVRKSARVAGPGVRVALHGDAAAAPGAANGSGRLVPSWLSNSVSFLASPDWIRKLAGSRLVERILTNKAERLPEPFRSGGSNFVKAQGEAAWGLEHIGTPDLWRQGLTGKGIRVGHLDTGVDPAHPDLKGRIAAWEAFDQFGHGLTGTPVYDSGFHGTHTAGTIAGRNAGGVAIGAAPGAEIVSALVLPQGSGTTKQIVSGMEWCVRQGVRVINLSLGGSGYNQAYEPAVRNLALLGVFPAFSVGNAGLGVTGSPANHRDACAVGAVNADNEVADFSGGGAFVWGGGDVYVKPDLCAPGVSIWSSIPTAYVRDTGGVPYDQIDGTSAAAPHISGVVALLWEAFPEATLDEVTEAIYSTCLDLGPSYHNMNSGRGLVQPLEALRKLEQITRTGAGPKTAQPVRALAGGVEPVDVAGGAPGNTIG